VAFGRWTIFSVKLNAKICNINIADGCPTTTDEKRRNPSEGAADNVGWRDVTALSPVLTSL